MYLPALGRSASLQSSAHTSPQAYRLHPRAGRRTMVVLSKIILSPEGGSGQRQRGARHLADRPQQAARKQEAGLDMGRRR